MLLLKTIALKVYDWELENLKKKKQFSTCKSGFEDVVLMARLFLMAQSK